MERIEPDDRLEALMKISPSLITIHTCIYVCVYTARVLLEVVRLQEFAVIQQVSQVSHKPPVIQGNAADQ